MQDRTDDNYSMDMVNKFYENAFGVIRHISWTLVVLNGTGAVTMLSLDVDKYKDAIYGFSYGLLSLASVFICISILINPCLYKRNIQNNYKVMVIYKLLFMIFAVGNIFSSISFLVGVSNAYDIIWKI